MPDRVIEGTWDEVIQRQDLRGHWVRVTVLDETATPTSSEPASWAARLREWAQSHPRVNHFVDDSREGIYGGTVDDPR